MCHFDPTLLLQQMIDQDRELFSFGSDVPPILLLLDRRDDPITPLLNQVHTHSCDCMPIQLLYHACNRLTNRVALNEVYKSLTVCCNYAVAMLVLGRA